MIIIFALITLSALYYQHRYKIANNLYQGYSKITKKQISIFTDIKLPSFYYQVSIKYGDSDSEIKLEASPFFDYEGNFDKNTFVSAIDTSIITFLVSRISE